MSNEDIYREISSTLVLRIELDKVKELFVQFGIAYSHNDCGEGRSWYCNEFDLDSGESVIMAKVPDIWYDEEQVTSSGVSIVVVFDERAFAKRVEYRIVEVGL